MKVYHKLTVMTVDKSDFFDKGQTEATDFIRQDLNTPDKRAQWAEASFVLLRLGNSQQVVIKSRY